MIDSNTPLLGIAEKVLTENSMFHIRRVTQLGYPGWKIIDRWCLNEPENVRAWEKWSIRHLITRAYQQMMKEREALEGERAQKMLSWMSEHEVLELYGVDMRLGLPSPLRRLNASRPM